MLSVTELRKQVHHIRYCKLQEPVFLRGETLRLCQKVKWKRVQQRNKDLVCAKKACLIVSTVLHLYIFLSYCSFFTSLSSCSTVLRSNFTGIKHPLQATEPTLLGKNGAHMWRIEPLDQKLCGARTVISAECLIQILFSLSLCIIKCLPPTLCNFFFCS